MIIDRSSHKSGIYAQWWSVWGYDKRNNWCQFLIFYDQADTIDKAIEFFNKSWPDCKGVQIGPSEPYSNELALCA